jgi:hypothetical protein
VLVAQGGFGCKCVEQIAGMRALNNETMMGSDPTRSFLLALVRDALFVG